MTKTVTYNGATTLSTVPPESIVAIEMAHMGETGIGNLTIHDSAGTVATVGHKALTITESSAPSGNQRVYTGRFGARHIKRGELSNGVAIGYVLQSQRRSVGCNTHDQLRGR